MKFWRKIGYSIMISAAVLSWTALPTWAGEWQQLEDGSWKYEEDGAYVTGWKQIDGIWYYMDPETELWDAAPALNETSACYLLENAVNKAGWYRNEESHMVYKVDSSDPYTITVSIMLEKEPDVLTNTLNTFDIRRKEKTAKSQQTKEVLNLYQ
ncbi:MAG: hypothetical protein MR868_13070 [Lachnospiraceae bacterium]|nr:hypothetical protein [Lachnospiraceae bacterium]